MNEPHFTTRTDALTLAEAVFRPADLEWTTNTIEDKWDAYRQVVSRFGALPTTMNFGLMELDLIANEVRFIAQDHKGGGDFLMHRAPLPPAWVTRLRTIVLWER
jgi:hypothetical protein